MLLFAGTGVVGPHEPSGHPIEPRLRRDPGEIDVQQPRLVWGDGPDELHELMRLGTAVEPDDAGWIQEGPLRLACPGGVVLDIPETRSPSQSARRQQAALGPRHAAVTRTAKWCSPSPRGCVHGCGDSGPVRVYHVPRTYHVPRRDAPRRLPHAMVGHRAAPPPLRPLAAERSPARRYRASRTMRSKSPSVASPMARWAM